MSQSDYLELTILPMHRAVRLKELLQQRHIEVHFEPKATIQPLFTPRVAVLAPKSDLPKLDQFFRDRPEVKSDYAVEWEVIEQSIRLLVPVDFSEYSWKACEFAFDYAARYNYKLTLLHVYFVSHFPFLYPETDVVLHEESELNLIETQRIQADRQSREFIQKISDAIENKELARAEYEFVLREGIPEEEIRSWTREKKPLMILMGTRGKNEKEYDLIGSVTAEVVDIATVPILAIPKDVPFSNIDHIERLAFLTNFDSRDLDSYDHLMQLEGFNEKKIIFFVLTDKIKEADEVSIRKRLDDRYPTMNIQFKLIDQSGLVSFADEYIAEHKIDVLVVPTHKRNVFARLFNPSIAQRVVFHSDTPILAIRD